VTAPDPPESLEVGRIDRAHGLRGDVVVRLVTDRLERVAPGSVLLTDTGSLEVRASTPHHERHIVSFVGVASREQADALRGVVLRAEPIDDPEVLWAHELIGCVVVDAEGVTRGRVEALQENPASDLLVLDTGALVPLRFVVAGPAGGRIDVDTPPGLFDL
jgi:16S rRNA processing protein RimM